MSFEKYNFKPFINKALKALDFISPKSIQEEIIPLLLANKNVVGQSETGSGKTHAFLLPIFQLVEPLGKVQVVITSPTRELAKQIYDMAQEIAKHKENEPYKIRLFVGGVDREKELAWLNNNQPDIVIGTPGRIWDYSIKERKLLIYQTQFFVIDEADMTLDAGFLKEVDNIAGLMPKDLNIAVFSATIPEGLKPFLNKYLAKPLYVNLANNHPTPKNLTHYLIKTKGKDKNKLLLNLMELINPYLAIIFCNTKIEVSEVAEFLQNNNYKVGKIHGDLPARERARMMRSIRDLRYTYIVATDIAARGIDIEGISHIINYSLPENEEFYIHRSGRSSRNNLTGEVYSFYDFNDDRYLNKLEAKKIIFNNVEIRKKALVPTRERNRRKKFVDQMSTKNIAKMPKNIKVKPNYKKKYKAKLEKGRKNKR